VIAYLTRIAYRDICFPVLASKFFDTDLLKQGEPSRTVVHVLNQVYDVFDLLTALAFLALFIRVAREQHLLAT